MDHRKHHKAMKRKAQRLTAAFAGAAVISAMMAPGIPIAQAYNQAQTSNEQPSSATGKTTDAQVDTSKRIHDKDRWREDKTGALHAHGSWQQAGSPVQVVINNAERFGFDAANDSFSLLSRTDNKAVVSVRTSRQKFKVDLVRQGSNWVISTIRGIGDSHTPATYTPASMFYSAITTPQTLAAEERILFETKDFKQWFWYEGAYPKDMSMAVFLQNPRLSKTLQVISPQGLARIANGNFGQQFVLYVNIGSVPSHGYGIGIEKVVQNGNDLTVTVRAKSPLANDRLTASQLDDFVTIDRTSVNFVVPIHIHFVNQDGAFLSDYTIEPQ